MTYEIQEISFDIYSNAVYPTQEQFTALLGSDFTGPVCMVNLLKFNAPPVLKDSY